MSKLLLIRKQRVLGRKQILMSTFSAHVVETKDIVLEF